MKTHLTIQYIGGHAGAFDVRRERSLWMVFVLASIGGLLFGTLFQNRSILNKIDPNTQLGSVGSVITGPDESISEKLIASSSTEIISETPTLSPAEVEAQRNAEISFTSKMNILNNEINAHELQIIRLNEEMKLVKDASVAVVMKFDQNCGNWKDDCGAAYASELEGYNVRYDELLGKRNESELLRRNAEESRTLLMEAQ